MVRETEPVPPSRHWPEVPPLLESACLRALSKDPARRFGTPTELADEVQKWQEVERKQAEDALRASEALYHSLVETIPMNVWRKDAAGRFTFANQGWCQTMGIRLDELIGKTDFDLFPPALAEGYRQGDVQILTTGTIYEATEEVIDRGRSSGGAYRSSSCPFEMDRAKSSARRESSGRHRRPGSLDSLRCQA